MDTRTFGLALPQKMRPHIDREFAHLLKVPSAIHFVSYEPAIGPLGQLDIDGLYPDWLIIGGESGVRSDLIRFTDPQWARDAIAECRRLGVAPFLKQWGTYKNNPSVVDEGCSEQQAMKIDPPENGKGGGKLDGRLWREFPINATKLILAMAARGRSAENDFRETNVMRWMIEGLIVEKVGPWAKDKLKILTDYIHASGGARSHYPGPGAAYIDVFCGPGRSKIRDTNEFIDGSPVAAFKKAKGSPAPFTSINISDADPDLLSTAEKRLKALAAPVRAVPGPASSAMPQIVQRSGSIGIAFCISRSS